MSYNKSNNSGPNLTGENDIVANRIFLIDNGQPVNLTDLFLNNTYVTDTANTKSEVDNLLIPKADAADVYTNSQTDIFFLNFKANNTDMINALNTKANTIDVNAALAFKANSTDVYTKTETETDNATEQYNKSQTGICLNFKAHNTDMMNALNTKANTIDVNAALAFKANTVDIYNKTQSDTALL